MDNNYDCVRSSRSRFWSFIGYLSFGILGLLLGAILVYGLFTFYLAPANEDFVTGPVGVNDTATETPQPDLPKSEQSLASIVDRVMPAVVGVTKHIYVTRFGERNLQEYESGSGVLISSDGYIVTNQHVVEDADKITVVIPNKGQYEAEFIGSDALTDLALLHIEAEGLVFMTLGDSEKVLVGESVVAIGNPLGFFQQTVTAGIVSAVERQVRIPGSDYAYTFIQTDALINPGNSGGPLVNTKGEIIGINTAKIALVGVEGIGLSIPSNTVKRVVSDLREYGRVLRPHLGIVVEDWLDYGDREPQRGILLVNIAPDSAADLAGLMTGDIIVAIDGQSINYLAQLFDRLLAYYPGDTVVITYHRDGIINQANLTLGERPESFEPVIIEEEQPDEGDE
ncbi:MAG: trypsin-like peptidase domain-containing protein [Bacillota bacterium]|nr:trypsin-like peptidase domain-containing protein [Bacillota bacterium]